MKFFFFFFVQLSLISAVSFSQNRRTEFNLFAAKIVGNVLSAYDKYDSLIFKKSFFNPSEYTTDLDMDGIDEYIVIDSISINGEPVYKIFLFNIVDSFYLVDSVNSGKMYPNFQINDETDEVIIISGNCDFDKYNLKSEFFFSPLNCWKYENSEFFLNNDEMYDFLISENEGLIEFIEEYGWQADSCASSKEILGAVASAYVNYLNAGEKVKAAQILRKYYLCSDFDQLKKEFKMLLGISD